MREYLCDDEILPDETLSEIIARSLNEAAHGRGLWTLWREGAFVGVVGASRPVGFMAEIDGIADEIEALIAIDAAHARKGYAAEALDAVAAYVKEGLGVHRLVAGVDAPNIASRRLMAKAGFIPFGEHPGPAHKIILYGRDI